MSGQPGLGRVMPPVCLSLLIGKMRILPTSGRQSLSVHTLSGSVFTTLFIIVVFASISGRGNSVNQGKELGSEWESLGSHELVGTSVGCLEENGRGVWSCILMDFLFSEIWVL